MYGNYRSKPITMVDAIESMACSESHALSHLINQNRSKRTQGLQNYFNGSHNEKYLLLSLINAIVKLS